MKDSTAVGLAALGMFAYGFLKTSVMKTRCNCFACTSGARRPLPDPAKAIHGTVTGPFMEELGYRMSLPDLIGKPASAAMFGLAHASHKLTPAGNVARVIEAGLAGGLVYQRAFDMAGLPGAVLVHGAHNLGTDLGMLLG